MLQFTAIFFQQAIQKGITEQHGDCLSFHGKGQKFFLHKLEVEKLSFTTVEHWPKPGVT